MNTEEAKTFVVAQGIGPDGLTVQARMGSDPGVAVFDQLIVALRELTNSLADQDLIEKFQMVTKPVIGKTRGRKLQDLIWNLAREPKATRLVDLATAKGL